MISARQAGFQHHGYDGSLSIGLYPVRVLSEVSCRLRDTSLQGKRPGNPGQDTVETFFRANDWGRVRRLSRQRGLG